MVKLDTLSLKTIEDQDFFETGHNIKMNSRVILMLVLALCFTQIDLVLAKRSPEEMAAKQEARLAKKAEKKRLRAEKKTKKAEAKAKIKADRLKKIAETKELLKFTKEDEAKLDRIFTKFVTYLGKDQHDYNYQIKSSSQLNAYATLGKKISIHSALFHKVKSEAGLATVIAHELGHVERKHVIKGVAAGVATSAAASAINIFTGTSAGSLLKMPGSQAINAYGRSHERSADLFAIDLMNKLYCDSPGKLELFNLLTKEKKNTTFSLYGSTHPLNSKRLAYMTTLIKDAGCVL